ncbi:MaoC family dehydratase N-terminal domain-containing protein [Longispora sp. NPDC051575]|uniref:FAS1-like dehydratase domain-containing protein n=1 Tax=Longispora sp. NPDC051575 TaxID=3154943 RepID=UPI0034233851
MFTNEAVHEVTRARIAQFAHAVGATHPAHFDPAAARALGHPDVIGPPTYPIVACLPVVTTILDTLAVNPRTGLHLEQTFRYFRPIAAGDLLAVTATITAARQIADNLILTLAMTVTSDGITVTQVRTALLLRPTPTTTDVTST